MTTPNAELAYAVLDHIDAHPEQWDQERWWRSADMAPGTACGTAGCFAGWAVALSGGQIARGEHTADARVASGLAAWAGAYVPVAAAALLGLSMEDPHSEDEAENLELFDQDNTREDFGRLVAEIFGPRPTLARDGMSDLYDCCPAAPTQPHTADCGLSQAEAES